MKNLIILPDGTEIFSGDKEVTNLRSTYLKQCVNSETELTLGSVCAAILECKIQTPNGALNIAAGTEVTLYKVDDAGTRHKAGLFTLEKPTRPSAHTYKLTAYDRISWLDKDLTEWLASLDGWPYSVFDFAHMVAAQCGLVLKNTSLLNGSYQIRKFSGQGITGRKLMEWIGQICAKFCRATPDGEIEFAWYTRKFNIEIAPYSYTREGVGYDVSFADGNLTIDSPAVAAFHGAEEALAITGQPEDYAGKVGETVSFTVSVNRTDVTYQWEYSKNGGETWLVSTGAGNNTATLYNVPLTEDRVGWQYRCIITDGDGNSVTSDVASIVVAEEALAITKQPADAIAADGEAISATVVAVGDGLTYQWYFARSGSDTFEVSSNTTATYSTTMNDMRNGYRVYCVITDAYGNTVTSNTATLTMDNTLSIITQPVDVAAYDGEAISIPVVANGKSLTYQWYFKPAGSAEFLASSNVTSAYTTTMTSARNGYQLYCVITDADGNTVTSATVTITMKTALAITKQPESMTAILGDMVSFSAESNKANVTITGLVVVSDDGDGNLVLAVDDGARTGLPFFANSLTYEDYETAPIERVRIQLTEDDVGAVYPDVAGNTYTITGNYLLTTDDAEALQGVAEGVYNAICDFRYTPCEVSIAANLGIGAGDIVCITDRNGKTITACIMTKTQRGQRDTLECTGSPRRDSSTALNNKTLKSLSGKVLEVRKSIDGLNIKATNLNSKIDGAVEEMVEQIAEVDIKANGISASVSALEQKVDTNAEQAKSQTAAVSLKADGISASVREVQQQVDTAAGKAAQNAEELVKVKEDMTTIQQNANNVSIQVQNIIDNGVNKVVNELGLTIDGTAVTIHRPGNEMTNNLDETGMYVIRSKGTSAEAKMLQANADGVVATDVSVRNYLIVGEHARFEDYSNGTDTKRTACFWID